MNEFTRSGKRCWVSWLSGALLVCIIVVTGTQANAGPFGLEMGMSKAEIEKKCVLVLISTDYYEAKKVPLPHSDFETYKLVIDEKFGLCHIIAISGLIETNRYGDKIKEKFDLIEKNLISKYGPNLKYDFVKAGSYWDEPQYWMMGLSKNERVYSAFWSAEDGSTPPEGVRGISLEAMAVSSEDGGIAISYESKNFKSWRAKMQKTEQESL